MLAKKFLSLLLAAGLAFGFSLNAGAVAVVNQDVLKIFNFENEKELEKSFTIVSCVKVMNGYFKDLGFLFKLNSKVVNLCKDFSNYYNMLCASANKNEKFTDFEQRDAIITEVTKVITEDTQFTEQLNRIINGKTKHESLQCINKTDKGNRIRKRWTGVHD